MAVDSIRNMAVCTIIYLTFSYCWTFRLFIIFFAITSHAIINIYASFVPTSHYFSGSDS